jgi:hypothetical protein
MVLRRWAISGLKVSIDLNELGWYWDSDFGIDGEDWMMRWKKDIDLETWGRKAWKEEEVVGVNRKI